MKVGDKIYKFEEWYHKPGEWRVYSIAGETSRSWILSGFQGEKISKKDLADGKLSRIIACSLDEVQQVEWVKQNGWRVMESVRWLKDYARLRAIAEITGYQEAANG